MSPVAAPVVRYLHTMPRLAAAVTEQRLAQGWGQQQLADAAGVPLEAVEHLEGEQPVRTGLVCTILETLGVKPVMLPYELLGVR